MQTKLKYGTLVRLLIPGEPRPRTPDFHDRRIEKHGHLWLLQGYDQWGNARIKSVASGAVLTMGPDWLEPAEEESA